jgi:hypothetical protein
MYLVIEDGAKNENIRNQVVDLVPKINSEIKVEDE